MFAKTIFAKKKKNYEKKILLGKKFAKKILLEKKFAKKIFAAPAT